MKLRTRFLITALFLCHQLPAAALVTSQLLAGNSSNAAAATRPPTGPTIEESGKEKNEKEKNENERDAKKDQREEKVEKKVPAPAATLGICDTRAATQLKDGTIICAIEQEKDGDIYKLHHEAEIHYRTYILRGDEMTYDSDSGESTAAGHLTLDGGPNDEHIKATHGTYNLTAETGRFYDASGTTGMRFRARSIVLTSTAPFAFSGKVVEKTSSDHYLVYDGTITTCELPRPKWEFDARKIVVDVGGNASIYHSSFWLYGLPVFYFPYATHPVAREVRQTGFMIPTIGRSSTNGNEVGDVFYWAINRSMDASIGGEYFSKRGGSERGEFRARPDDHSYMDLNYFGVIDRGIAIDTPTGPQSLREGGQEARLTAESNFYGFRAVSNVDYLSSFLFRLAFSEVYTQAVNSEVKSQVFLSKTIDGFSVGGMVERYQDFFQSSVNGVLSNPPIFDDVRILHAPSVDASSVDHSLGRSPFLWSFDASLGGLARSEPGFHTGTLLGRIDFNPQISLPLQFRGWSLRPALTLHETFYSQRFVGGAAQNDPTNRQALETSVELRPPTLEKIFDPEFLGRKWKHVIEPRAVYRLVTGVNDFANVLHFDERDILSNTHEVEYGFVTRLYAKRTAAQSSSKPNDCDTPMAGLAVGSAAPEQTVPWLHTDNLDKPGCAPEPAVREVATWEIAQKYFLDPTFGGALVPGQRNVFTTTEELTGIAFVTDPRHLSPLVSRLRIATSAHTDTEWDMDYDFQLGRINESTLLVNYNMGPFTMGGGDAFLQIPQLVPTSSSTSPIESEGQCSPATTATTRVTCKFQQFRVALGYGALTKRGISAAGSFGFDDESRQLQFASAQTTYNWDCCGMTLEYRRYAIANVRNENLFRFTFTLANIGSLGNLRRQERLY